MSIQILNLDSKEQICLTFKGIEYFINAKEVIITHSVGIKDPSIDLKFFGYQVRK